MGTTSDRSRDVDNDGTREADNDPTDELPVLSEAFRSDTDEPPVVTLQSRTPVKPDWHGRRSSDTCEDPGNPGELPVLTERADGPATDTADIPVLTEELAVDAFRPPTVSPASDPETRATAVSPHGSELLAQVAEHEARLREALDQLVKVKDQAAVIRTAFEAGQQDRGAPAAQRDEPRAPTAASSSASGHDGSGTQSDTAGAQDRTTLEELATLSHYVTNRQRWWQEMEVRVAAQRNRIAELELEVEHRLQRQRVAEELARKESERAQALRAELAVVSRELANRGSKLQTRPLQIRAHAPAEDTHALPAGGSDAPHPLDRLDAPGPSPGPALIALAAGDAEPRRYVLARDRMTIGRGPHCDIQVTEQFVSREHARLEIGEHAVTIEDAGSRNGVYVNASRVHRQTLRNGDLVSIGEARFRFAQDMPH